MNDDKEKPKAELSCTFCGKGTSEVFKMIAGPGVYICDACVRLCFDIIIEEKMLNRIYELEAEVTTLNDTLLENGEATS